MWCITLSIVSMVTSSGTLINYSVTAIPARRGCFFLNLSEPTALISQDSMWPCLFLFFSTFCPIVLWK